MAGRLTKASVVATSAAVLADGGPNGIGANVIGGETSFGFNLPALSITGNGVGNQLIGACNQGEGNPCFTGGGITAAFTLDTSGNVAITGTITTTGSCHTGCSPRSTSSEGRVRYYTPRESLPTVEDFGEGQLVNGQTYVRIDPNFANTMDPQSVYMVFITPEGDSRGVYVTAKTSMGFLVRENQGGRSTLAFSYRIVAKPYGEHPTRLQMITMALPRSHPQTRLFPTSR